MPAKYASMNGEIVPWAEATVHAYSPVAKYGAGVFEGIRGYWNAEHEQMYVFRLQEHLQRLRQSQILMRFERIVDEQTIARQILELLRANAFRETVHIRPSVYVDGTGGSGARGPIGVSITAVPRARAPFVETGCSAQISSWVRIADTAMPARVKANANYNNSRLAAIQAQDDGYDTAIMLNARGKVSEGPGMCFFMIRRGVPVTPGVGNDILESITRDTVLELLREFDGLKPVERDVDRSELYDAEEAFFCGTAWEVTPVTSIDRLRIGDGEIGAVTRRLQGRYFDIVQARTDDYPHWRTPVYD